MSHAETTAAPQVRRPRRWFRRVLLTLIVLICACAGVGYYLWQGVPGDYLAFQKYLDALSPEQRKQVSQSVAARFTTTLAQMLTAAATAEGAGGSGGLAGSATGAEPIDFTLPVQDASVWLSEEFPGFIQRQGHTWPSQISRLMINIRDRAMTLRFRFESPELSQVVSVTSRPHISEDGTATSSIESIKGGNLPLPPESLVGAVQKNAPTQAASEAIGRVRTIMDGQPFPLRFKFDDKHDVTCVGWSSDGVNLTLRLKLQPVLATVATAK